MSQRRPAGFTIYKFYVRLRGFQPAIWRSVCVADCLLDDLMQSLLVALGWQSEHTLRCTALEAPCPALDGMSSYDWPLIWLSQVLAEDDTELRLRCELGRDDPWRFEILYQACATSALGAMYPLCVAGDRAGIPDESIEPQTFRAYLDALAHPGHPQHAVLRRSSDYDPARFNLPAVNADLRRLCKPQNPIDDEGRAFRVRVTAAERALFFEHARVNGLAFDWLRNDWPPSVLRVHGPDAAAAARSLALAANRCAPDRVQRQLERLAGRFYRCAVEQRERVKQIRAQHQPELLEAHIDWTQMTEARPPCRNG